MAPSVPHAAPTHAPGRLVALSAASLTAALAVGLAVFPWGRHAYLWDFRAFYAAGHDYLHGTSPYPPSTLAALTSNRNFVYPLPVAAVFSPLAALPFALAAAIYVALNVGAIVAGLRVLRVNDWRCYAVAFLSLPAQYALKLGTITPLLFLLLALAWRYRDRPLVAAPTLAALVLAKVFLWPVGVWYLVTRRFGALLGAILLAVVATALSVIPTGLHTLTGYPHLLHILSDFESTFSWSLVALGRSLGLSPFTSTLLEIVLGVCTLAAVAFFARSGLELESFAAALGASLLLSPIVWGHYLLLCLVPLALRRPRFSPVWLATAWIFPNSGLFNGWRPYWIVLACICVALQLGLDERLPRPSDRLSWSLATALVLVVVLFFASARFIAGTTRSVALHGTGGLSGTAALRFRPEQICWVVWTQGAASGPIDVRLSVPRARSNTAAAQSLDSRAALRYGKAQGCVSVDSPRTHNGLPSDWRLYELSIQRPGAHAFLTGALQNPTDVGYGR